MQDLMLRFLDSIHLEDPESFDLDFDKVGRDVNDPSTIVLSMVKETPWTYLQLLDFQTGLASVNYRYAIGFRYACEITVSDVEELLRDVHFNNSSFVFGSAQFERGKNPNEIVFADGNEETINDFNELLTWLGYPYRVVSKDDSPSEEPEPAPIRESSDDPDAIEPIEERDFDEEMDAEEEASIKAAEESYIENLERVARARSIRSSAHTDNYVHIDELREIYSHGMGNVEFEGMVCKEKPEPRVNRKGKVTLVVPVGGVEGGVHVRFVENDYEDGISAKFITDLKGGTYVKVKGAISLDHMSGEIMVTAHHAEVVSPELRDDPEEEKRVELHLHTKMSQMDGLGEATDYVNLAKHMGMKAIAVTDHGCIQAYPEIESACKKAGIKPIYGIEFYMIDTPKPAFGGHSDIELSKARYCVFDFETTGLSHTYDRPIEFGGVIFENGMVTKRFDTFINPEMPIPEVSTRINHIDDEMVKDAPTMVQAMDDINDFIKDTILVSHNAQFDIAFLNMMRKAAGQPPVDNPVVDTLAVAQYLLPEAGSLREGAVSRRLGLDAYDDAKAHRADFDAEVLAKIWQVMITMIGKNVGSEKPTLEDVNRLSTDKQDFYKHVKAFHTVALAKNQAGIKDLFRLISESETSYLAPSGGGTAAMPKMPRDFLDKNRGNLLLGSACFNGRVFEMAMNGTQEDLEKEMSFYDYIEIQPKENYSWLIGMESITEERLMTILNRIIETADKLGKMVVATGDAHYVNPRDKILRDIYIRTDGLNKSIHPLQRGRRHHAPFPNPDQHFRSTREMLDSFAQWLPEEKCREIVIKNTNAIADQIEGGLLILKDRLYTPDANLPGSAEKLKELCYGNLRKTYGDNPDPAIVTRLQKELDGIINNGYSVTYYIAHLLVKHAADEGYYVGSRGSVGSSFAATMAGITEVNPLPPHYLCPDCKHFEWANEQEEFRTLRSGFDLPHKKCPHCGHELIRDGQSIPFETFLGFSAEKVPDIDLNFPQDYQENAFMYTRSLLSTEEENKIIAEGKFVHSPHVIRAGTIAAAEEKNAFGYVRGFYEERYGIKTIPLEEKASADCLAYLCSGVKRTTGQHPGGIVVIPADMDIFDFTPFQHPADDPAAPLLTTHFAFASMHDSVLKLDELGHLDPMALREMCLLTGINLSNVKNEIPVDDPAILSLFTSPDALKLKNNPLNFKTGAIALPEFGTTFVQGLLEDAKPKTFNDLLIISGLSHGADVWNNNAQELVRSGKTLDQVIGCRDDIMNYLISMGVDNSVAFKTMEGVRKGKKLTKDQDAAMRACNVPEWYIASCNKIKYLFPRAHATAYVIGALRVAYFKVYHPLEFYAVYFRTRCDKFDIKTMSSSYDVLKDSVLNLQARRAKEGRQFPDTDEELLKTETAALEMVDRGYHINNIDIMKSDANNWIVDHETKSLIPPFAVIAGFQAAQAQKIIESRKDGSFLSKEDIKNRAGIGDSAIKALDEIGALVGYEETNQMSLFDFSF